MKRAFFIILILSGFAFAGENVVPSKYGTKEEFDLWRLVSYCREHKIELSVDNLSRCKEFVNDLNKSNFYKVPGGKYPVDFERFLTIYKALFYGAETKVFILDTSIIDSYYQIFRKFEMDLDYGISVSRDQNYVTMSFMKKGASLGKIFFFCL